MLNGKREAIGDHKTAPKMKAFQMILGESTAKMIPVQGVHGEVLRQDEGLDSAKERFYAT